MYRIAIVDDEKFFTDQLVEDIKQAAEKFGNRYMLEANVPPHITISAFESENEDELVCCLEQLVMGSNIVGDAGIDVRSMEKDAGCGRTAGLKQGKFQSI